MILKILKSENGISLVEVILSMGLMGMGAYLMLGMGDTTNKQMNGIEFKLLSEQYKMQTMGQFLSSSHNCKCLLNNIEFDKAPASKIQDAGTSTYTSLGFFTSNCSALQSEYLTNTENSDGVKITNIKLTDVEYVNNRYYGNLSVNLSSKKIMMGNNARGFKLPVSVRVVDSSTAGRVKVEGCSMTAGLTDGSPFKIPDPALGPWSIPLNPSSGNFVFPNLPSTASGVYIQYMIGSSANGRADRNCDITGSGISVKLGTDSKGDGGQRFVAGSAYVPIDGCGSTAPMRYSCNNSNNRGEFRVVAYIDDGNAPTCSSPALTCPPGQVFDGMGGCSPTVADTTDCPNGYTYNASTDACDQNTVSCTPPQVAFYGTCVDVTPAVTP